MALAGREVQGRVAAGAFDGRVGPGFEQASGGVGRELRVRRQNDGASHHR